MTLSVGISPCPNDVFIFSGILLKKIKTDLDFEFHFEDVETLNRMAQRNALDITKMSYANAAHCTGYQLLDCGGALGRNCGPLLLTGGNHWNADSEVLVPGENTTAHFLLNFWAEKTLQKKFLSFDVLYQNLKTNASAQGVVIHEMRFTYAADGLHLVQDLGQYWESATGYPIPLGVVAAQKKVSPEILKPLIRASLAWAWSHEAEALALCAHYSQSMDPAIIRSHVNLYVNEFTYDLGKEGHAAVAYFLNL